VLAFRVPPFSRHLHAFSLRRDPRRLRRLVGFLLSPKPVSEIVEEPVVINLYPSQSVGSVPRLVIMATSVGSVSVSMPLVFDTGSAGVTLYAPTIFPSSMVSTSGFAFPTGQTSITYNGITVTNQEGARTYGSTDLRVQHGNIGYAQLTFGDTQGQLRTGLMPVFLYYSVTDVTTGQPVEVPSFQQGVFRRREQQRYHRAAGLRGACRRISRLRNGNEKHVLCS
jgi:hypothetical protein